MIKGCGKTFNNYIYYDDDDYEGEFCYFKWAEYIDYSKSIDDSTRYVSRICGIRNLPYSQQGIDFCQACCIKPTENPIIVIERLLFNHVPIVIFSIIKQYLY